MGNLSASRHRRILAGSFLCPCSPKVVFFLAREEAGGAFPNLTTVSCFLSKKSTNEHRAPLSFPSSSCLPASQCLWLLMFVTNTLPMTNAKLTYPSLMTIQSLMPGSKAWDGEERWKTAQERKERR
uniref:Uncharacterized protein n=1 Tax=Pipistrellus kuhlii TaxID=59472 RepID=A0A7J7XBX6_PIPKU|nr:hypothetical protein mPipKuh1_010631 [Pipistrellus kuhlii]